MLKLFNDYQHELKLINL